MALILTNVYLEEGQRKTLERLVKKNHSNLSVEVRNAVDLYSSGMSINDLNLLDEITRKAKSDIDDMNAVLEVGLRRAKKFFSDIEKLKAAS